MATVYTKGDLVIEVNDVGFPGIITIKHGKNPAIDLTLWAEGGEDKEAAIMVEVSSQSRVLLDTEAGALSLRVVAQPK